MCLVYHDDKQSVSRLQSHASMGQENTKQTSSKKTTTPEEGGCASSNELLNPSDPTCPLAESKVLNDLKSCFSDIEDAAVCSLSQQNPMMMMMMVVVVAAYHIAS